MSSSTSPFSQSRYEHDGLHLYYIEDDTLSALEGDVPIIITGSRGTGKTTLLKALNWKEQKYNEYLQAALRINTHRDDYIGIYLKLPNLKIGSFSKWEKCNSETYTLIFSFYLELVWLQEAVTAVTELRSAGDLNFSGRDELGAVQRIRTKFSSIFESDAFSKKLVTLIELADSIRTIREYIEEAAIFDIDVSALFKKLNGVQQYGEFSNFSSKVLASLFPSDSAKPIKFKICMDECERLSELQVLVIATLLRVCEFPVFYVFSYIGKSFDSKQTLIPNLTNQKADVQKIDLDHMSFKKFEAFSNGVSSVRVAAWLQDSSVDFDISSILGKGPINKLLEGALKKSESPKARELLQKATENIDSPFFEPYKDEGLPLYQTYLVQQLDIDIKSNLESPKDRRWQESKEIRKKMVVAYLSICKEFNLQPLYAYSYMVYRISDRSIRDYILQLDEIFKEANLDLEKFIRSPISIECQNRAIRKASHKKLQSIQSSSVTTADPVAKLVIGLGVITEAIQTKSADKSHLRSSERGIFTVSLGSCDEEILSIIHQSSDAGFVKILPSNESTLRFRVHNSLAPEFGFSYRGAYYTTPIEASQIRTLIGSNNKLDLEERAKIVSESIYKLVDRQERLF